MMTTTFKDIQEAAEKIMKGGIILYPTDTIWGLGCDAKNEAAVARIFALKNRADSKSLIVLCTQEMVTTYAGMPYPQELVAEYTKPVTIIYPAGNDLAKQVIHSDGSIAIRVPQDAYCIQLIEACGVPIVSTSANISQAASPRIFDEISEEIKNGVDYIAHHRRDDFNIAEPSTILKLGKDGSTEIIRP